MAFALERSLLHLLHRASQAADELFDEKLPSDQLTPRQFVVLMTVLEADGLNQTEIVQRTGIDRSTLTGIVQRLLVKGLLSRRRSRLDRRAYEVRLSPVGLNVLEAAMPVVSEVDERLLTKLAPGQTDELFALLRLLAGGIPRTTLTK